MLELQKILMAFALLTLFNFINCQDQTYKCTQDIIQQICPIKENDSVCALNENSIFQTYDSACEVCKLGHVQQYTHGQCQCPKLECLENQSCFSGICVANQHFKKEDGSKTALNLFNAGQYEKAIKILNKQIQEDPGNSYLFYLKAYSNMQLKNHKQALKNIKSAIERKADISNYYIIRGRIMGQLQMFQQGRKQFLKAKSLGHQDLGQIFYYQAQNLVSDKKYQEAILKFEAAIKLHPTKVQWHLRKALAHAINDENAMALITLKQAKKLNPTQRQIFEINALLEQFQQIINGQGIKLQRQQQKNEKISTQRKKMQPRIEKDSQGNIVVLNQHGQPVPVSENKQKKTNVQQMNLDQPVQQQKSKKEQRQNQDIKDGIDQL